MDKRIRDYERDITTQLLLDKKLPLDDVACLGVKVKHTTIRAELKQLIKDGKKYH